MKILKFYESTGNKYLKRKYPYEFLDDFDNFENKYKDMKLDKEKNQIIYNDYEKEWIIYKNPKSLENFGKSVRGVITENGDLYIENISKGTIHHDILKILYEKNILDGEFNKRWTKKLPTETGFLTVQRYNETNIIAIGESNRLLYDEMDWKNRKHIYENILEKARNKNPKIDFRNKLIGIKFQALKKSSNNKNIVEEGINLLKK